MLELAAEEMDRADPTRIAPLIRICGKTAQASSKPGCCMTSATIWVFLAWLRCAMCDADQQQLIGHNCPTVAGVIPLVGFYLQPAVGGRVLPFSFWRSFAELEGVVAIKIAPFNRYQTSDVVRAVIEAERDDIALYTDNDDNIVMDLLTPYRFMRHGKPVERRMVDGLLGHWSVCGRKRRSSCSHVATR